MALDYKTPKQIAEQYLVHLKSLKPEVDTAQADSDWWVRGQVVGGAFAGIYADQRKIADDAFPQSARREALERHVNLYFAEGFEQPTKSVGFALVTGASGSSFPIGTQLQYAPNGNQYAATDTINLGSAVTGRVPIQSISTGQNQNLLNGAALQVVSPPAGIDGAAITDGELRDGRNEETNEQAATRILRQIRTPLAGGKTSDYQTFALNADPAVTSVSVLRFPFGLGTVGVVITAGTTDIDEAIDNGQPIVLLPSAELVAKVQAYIETQKPVTDCPTVLSPASVPIDVTLTVRYANGDNDTVPAGFSLTQEQIVIREVSRAIFKTPPGGRILGASGYVVLAEIEETLDLNLSVGPYIIGEKAQILSDRQVDNLAASGPNRSLLGNEVAFPGTITVIEA